MVFLIRNHFVGATPCLPRVEILVLPQESALDIGMIRDLASVTSAPCSCQISIVIEIPGSRIIASLSLCNCLASLAGRPISEPAKNLIWKHASLNTFPQLCRQPRDFRSSAATSFYFPILLAVQTPTTHRLSQIILSWNPCRWKM